MLLHDIQQKLNVPKLKKAKNYTYRSCEDILEAVKPLLIECGGVLTMTDCPVVIEGWHYIKATVSLKSGDGQEYYTNEGYAREAESSQVMGVDQITGSASSYARKYALNGLFCIDDSRDPDDPKTKTLPQELQKKEEEFLNMVCNTLKLPKGFLLNRKNIKAAIITELKGKPFPTEESRVKNTVSMLMTKYEKTIFEKDPIPFEG